ncbi:TPA: hypothetical protein DCX16_05185 [bacterium]|nr:hypothetical protein [bacterium]
MMSEIIEKIREFINKNPKGAIGGLVGVLFGLIIITFGPFEAGILILSCIIGYIIGRRL